MANVTMRQMLEAGVHFGHRTRYWNPQMAPYIFGIRSRIHIIDLEQTLPLFREALNFISSIVANKGKVLFVGTKFAAREVVAKYAASCNMPYVDDRWLGGTLTNYKTMRQSIKQLKELDHLLDQENKGSQYRGLTKKELLNLHRKRDKLQRSLGGIKNMGGLPDALFVIDVGNEKIAISEANRLGIPVIAVVDTNCSPAGVDYIIPGNDDSIRAIELYAGCVAETVADAQRITAEAAAAHAAEEALNKAAAKKEAPAVAAKGKVVTKKKAVSAAGGQEAEVTEAAPAAEPAKKRVSRVVKGEEQEQAKETKPKTKAEPKAKEAKSVKSEQGTTDSNKE
jgi:small subunit ribosomal protein S2